MLTRMYIAAVALTSSLSAAEIASAGLFVASAVALLSITGFLSVFSRAIPVPIVKGIQLGAGLSLSMSAFSQIPRNVPVAMAAYVIITFVVSLLILLLSATHPRVPFALTIISLSIVWMIGLSIAKAAGDSTFPEDPRFSIWHPVPLVPSPKEFLSGSLSAGLGQLPLTTLNSIIAVLFLAQDLFPSSSTYEHPATASLSATSIGLSVTAMNFVGCFLGAMPLCHGSGGLAAQYRFGARSGASVIFLGTLKLVLGLFASEYVSFWSRWFWPGGLGLLIFVAGIELAKMGESINGEGARDLWEVSNSAASGEDARDGQSEEGKRVRKLGKEEKMRRYVVMIVTVGALLGAKNDGVGFVAGLVVHGAYLVQDWVEARREGRIRLERSTAEGERMDRED